MTATTGLALQVSDVRKAFGGTQALDGVSFELDRGSVHGLLGGNGSGKSTMIKVLAGVYRADAGWLKIRGSRIEASSMNPARAREEGMRFVHQQESTFPSLTVAENLAIGHGFGGGAMQRIRWRTVKRRTAGVLERFEIHASPDDRLGDLRPATQAMVTIARALQDQDGEQDGVLVLDEPTASLPSSEVELLLGALRRYAAAGQTILYVTHRLEEVLQIADRATVFRDGRVVGTAERDELTHDALVEVIMGRRVEQILSRSHGRIAGEVLVRLRQVSAGSVRSASFEAHRGEIVGIAGLLGSGRSTILRALFGSVPLAAGSIELEGREVRFDEPRAAIAAGVAYVPEDRLGEAAFPDLSVLVNLGMATTTRYFRGVRMRHRAERRDAQELLDAYSIKTASLDAPFSAMSGGNQQKVVLARWMRRKPKLLLLDEPTQGVDVGARAEIWQLVRKAVDAGAAALVVSSDYDELARVCDRAVVLRNGCVAAELHGEDLTEEHLTYLTLTEELAR